MPGVLKQMKRSQKRKPSPISWFGGRRDASTPYLVQRSHMIVHLHTYGFNDIIKLHLEVQLLACYLPTVLAT